MRFWSSFFKQSKKSPPLSHDLEAAIKDGSVKKIEALIKQKPDLVSCRNERGETPLHIAALKGNSSLVELLLANGGEINGRCDSGDTPLMVAAVLGHKTVVELLLGRGAEYRTIHEAAAVGDLEKVRALIAGNPRLVRSKNRHGDTPLHDVANAEIARLLLANGAKVGAKNEDGWTPLHGAAFTGRVAVAVVLLAHGADVNAKDRNAFTPWHMAMNTSHLDEQNLEMVKLLVASGADTRATDKFGIVAGR